MRGAVVVDGLAKSYGSVPALRGISFTVGAGEIFALLGPNGAGKTTTLEILEGFRARDAGRAEVLGLDPGDRATGRELRERIGLVLQDIAVEPYLTVRETIARNAGYYPAPRGVDEVIALVGLAGQERTKVRNLSGGRKRRLDLALGLIGDPELLFLDEPTTGFDPAARRDAWQLVRSLRDSGTTILLTTHYMEEAQALADRVAVLSDGQVVAQGTLADHRRAGHRPDPDPFRAPERMPGRGPPGLGPPPVERGEPAAEPEPGGLVTVAVSEPTRALHELTSWALDRGLVLDQLTVEPPSLEDVYLRLTDPGPAASAEKGHTQAERAGANGPEKGPRHDPDDRPARRRDLALLWHQVRYEQLSFWRNPQSAFFTFVFPVVIITLFGALFGGVGRSSYFYGLSALQYYVPTIAAVSVLGACYSQLAIVLSTRRQNGILKRVRATPLPGLDLLPRPAGPLHRGQRGGHRAHRGRRPAVRRAAAHPLGRDRGRPRARRGLFLRAGRRGGLADPQRGGRPGRRAAGLVPAGVHLGHLPPDPLPGAPTASPGSCRCGRSTRP